MFTIRHTIVLLLGVAMFVFSACKEIKPQASDALLTSEAACAAEDLQACDRLEEAYWAKVRHLNLVAFKEDCAEEAKLNTDVKSVCRLADMYNFLKEDWFPSDGHLRLRRAMEAACKASYAEACRKLADIYSHERGSIDINHIEIFRDDEAALELRMKACDLGDYWSCKSVGYQYFDGRGLNESRLTPEVVELYAERRRKIRGFFETKCDESDGLSCYNLAIAYGHFGHAHLKPFGVEADIPRALDLLEQGCSLNDWDSCLRAGQLYLEGEDVSEDRALADDYLRRGCNLGDPSACSRRYQLLYKNGDEEAARKSLKRACQMKRSDDVFVRVRARNVQCQFLDRN
ncbi:tetratricopeptide repeat protein [Henriciella sp.]|uniref:tetratricopeptide repeat protein n=1 Tax=Henriciella sp. TaxID=1968823 RepID=UPI00260954FC|nr:tetratricopeptide repeat protein [Henriciella sp.]